MFSHFDKHWNWTMKLCKAAALLFSWLATSDASVSSQQQEVVIKMQQMESNIEAAGVQEFNSFAAFAQSCRSNLDSMHKTFADTQGKMRSLVSAIKYAEGQKEKLAEDLQGIHEDIIQARADKADATSIREGEAAAYKAESDECSFILSRLNTVSNAGRQHALLSTATAALLTQFAEGKLGLAEDNRHQLLILLSQDATEVPESGQFVSGSIFKQAIYQIAKSLVDVAASEKAAISTFREFMADTTRTMHLSTSLIVPKKQQIKKLEDEITHMQLSLSSVRKSLAEETTFLSNLARTCAKTQAEFNLRAKARSRKLLDLWNSINAIKHPNGKSGHAKPSLNFLSTGVF
eukprot:gnl/TRDRNA2_/TRDRNA2_181380_c0_seq1.p1 gnl/TRDRNA2_/TRDRNA2_181380_c0~~gnl/TRDRNA2_/TRDRNA2_181380_c0_seq1.p1  ORF type:complete len:348 (+),score=57.29 gnl/TRDRNA2_/TRDRNA2_181380_c0_seq1:22-1065(+)